VCRNATQFELFHLQAKYVHQQLIVLEKSFFLSKILLGLLLYLFKIIVNGCRKEVFFCLSTVDFHYDQGELKKIKSWKEKFYNHLIGEALPDLRIKIEDIVANKDLVITRWKARGTLKGTLFGVTPSGEMFEFNGTSWMKLFEGKIVEMWTNWDLSYLMNRLLSAVKELRGLIPICSYCKGIRDEKGCWTKLEKYITEHSDVQFSHGICQECAKKHPPDMDLYGNDES
jgi:predicted ester cyclase